MGIGNVRVGAALLCAAIVVACLSVFGALDRWERPAFDAAMRANRALALQPAPDDIVVVGIDEAFLDTVDEPLALSHRYLARFLAVMADARPAAVGLDVVLPEKRFDTLAPVSAPDTDYHRTLVAGLLQATQHFPLVVAKAWDGDRGHYRDLQTDYVAVLEMQPGGFAPQGSVLLCPDADGVIRRYPGADCQPDGSGSTFASELAAAAGRRARTGAGLIDFRVGGEFQYVPLQEVFRLEAGGDQARLAQLFDGKVVLLGAILDETDLVTLPVSMAEWRPGNPQVPGVLVHAQLLRNLFTDGLVRPLPPALQFALVLAAALLVAAPARPRVAALVFTILLAALAAATLGLLREGIALAPAAPALAAGLVLVLRFGIANSRTRRHRSQVREAFAGHVDEAMLRSLIGGGTPPPVMAERPMAFLECELRLDRAGAAAPSATELARLCTGFLDDVATAVHRHGGTLDTTGGTRVGAFFGGVAALPCPGKDALEAAADIVDALARRISGVDARPPAVQVAVHAADAVAALLPSRGREHYTVLGDGFRTTSRLLASDASAPIVCSPELAEALGRPPFLRDTGQDSFGWNPLADGAATQSLMEASH